MPLFEIKQGTRLLWRMNMKLLRNGGSAISSRIFVLKVLALFVLHTNRYALETFILMSGEGFKYYNSLSTYLREFFSNSARDGSFRR